MKHRVAPPPHLDPTAVRTGSIKLYSAAQFPVSEACTMSSRSSSPEPSPLTLGQDLTPLPNYKAAATSTISFSDLLSPPLKLHEDLTSGCGGQLWPAGMVLAKYMLRYHRDGLKDAKMFVRPMCSPFSLVRILTGGYQLTKRYCSIKT